MHGLSPDTDLGPLNGSTLTFVGFGEHQVQLAFYGDDLTHRSISIEGDYVVTTSGREPIVVSEARAGAVGLLSLLSRTVARASVPTDGTVRIDFDDGSVVEVLDSSTRYESYQVNLGDRLLVV